MTAEQQEAALLAHVLHLIADRGPQYQRAAHLIVDASDRAPAALAGEIARKAEHWMRSVRSKDEEKQPEAIS